MRALVCDGSQVALQDKPLVAPGPHEVAIRVRMAGICRTDLELAQGYMDFSGTLGHEFVGQVPDDADGPLAGQRVVGDINNACGECDVCLSGNPHHCPNRTVLGIDRRDGAFAEWLSLHERNVLLVPDGLSDEIATFAEPVAAAYEIGEQVRITSGSPATVLGDGKLGLLCAQVLADLGAEVSLIGRHEEKLAIARDWGIRTFLDTDEPPSAAPLVVEATGRAAGCRRAVELVQPQGTLVLKSTVAEPDALPVVPLVVNEITVVGSRCGPMDKAIAALAEERIDVLPLVEATYRLADGVEAMAHAGRPGALKILLDMRTELS